MFTTTHTIKRLTTAIAIASALTLLAVPQALAGSNSRYGPLDTWAISYLATHAQLAKTPTGGIFPDDRPFSRLQATAPASAPAIAPTYGPPDPWQLHLAQFNQSVSARVGIAPDDRPGIRGANPTGLGVASSGISTGTSFSWGDASIGGAIGFGLALLLLGTVLAVMRRNQSRERTGTAVTA